MLIWFNCILYLLQQRTRHLLNVICSITHVHFVPFSFFFTTQFTHFWMDEDVYWSVDFLFSKQSLTFVSQHTKIQKRYEITYRHVVLFSIQTKTKQFSLVCILQINYKLKNLLMVYPHLHFYGKSHRNWKIIVVLFTQINDLIDRFCKRF